MIRAFLCAVALCATLFISGRALAGEVSFAYQGRVKVQGASFSGTGYFKFSIMDTSGTTTLWSHDATGVSGSEPVGFLSLPVSDGIFNVLIGDTSDALQQPINATIFNSQTPLKLRVWFSDGTRGFQQLLPDHNLVNLTLNVLETGSQDFTIYVDGTSGNDRNNGLTPSTAKKTIQAAVDALPERIKCNVTIDIAPGTYREQVTPHGFSVGYGKVVKFIGDRTWNPSSGGTPNVIISGADSSGNPVRDHGIYAQQCSNVIFEGLCFEKSIQSGLTVENGAYTINRCLVHGLVLLPNSNSGVGFVAGPQAHAQFNECKAANNGNSGFAVTSSSRGFLTTCTSTMNYTGVYSGANSLTQFFETNYFTNNVVGVASNSFSDASVWPSSTAANKTYIQNNSECGAKINWGSLFTPANAVISGNATTYIRYYGKVVGVDPQ